MEENKEILEEELDNELDEKPEKEKKFRINPHIVFGVAAIVIIAIIISKITGFFSNTISREDIDSISAPPNPEIQAFDEILPNMAEDDGTFPADDGVTTVVCFGNAPFADDRDADGNLCKLFADETGATVYNCAVPGSFMSSFYDPFQNDYFPMDAFSFCRLATAFTQDDYSMVDAAIEMYDAVEYDTTEIKKAMDVLRGIDFETVDAIFIMYDGTDYLNGRKMYNDDNFTDVTCFTGSMAAGVEMIQEKFPWIRIIVMSPTYTFGVDENGNYVSSDVKTYGQHFLSTYVIKQAEAAYALQVSFVDNLYGSIHEDIAPDYLTDNLHLNQEGRKLLVPRMVDALERYTTIY